MKNQKERKYPSVKVRLAPLPIRNLNLGNTLNLEECLNRSVAMDRPLSRMSDLSNFSSNSMISVARSNYEVQSDELRRQSNRNLIEALRSKDIRRRRRPNYLNNNQDNYSVDLNFNRSQPNINYQQNNQQQIKRKRDIYDDDEESELDYGLFNSNNKTTKFAKTDSLQIPSKNRFVSSQYKNNEIASSYYSINNPINQLNNHNQFKSNRLTKRSLSNQDLDSNKKIFKVPLMVHSNSSSKENTLNVSNSINLSNSSISSINKNHNSNELQKQISINSSSNSSALFKSLNNSSNEMNVDNDQLITKDQSNNRLSIDNLQDKDTNDDSFAEVKDDAYNFKIPEHLHSIDEHMRDENKAKSRLGAFLKAICNVTSLLPSSNKIDSNSSTLSNAELNKDKNSSQISSTITSATVTTSSLFNPSSSNNLITTTTTTNSNTKTTDSLKPTTQFKFPTISDSKSTAAKTSTPAKVTFNLPNSTSSTLNKSNTITNTTNNDSSIFKFGQTTNNQTNTKIETSTNSSAVFKFGDTGNLDKPKESTATTTSMFTLPSTTTASSNTKFNIQNLSFSFTNKEANSTALNNTSINKSFGTNLSSSFALPTTNSTAMSNLPSNSLFTFGKDLQTTTTQDLNKSSSNVFKFGNPSSTATNAISNTTADKPATNTAPVFNFGQSSNQPQKNISTSGYNFSASIPPNNNNLNSNLSLKPASTPFAFGNLNTSQQIEQSISKPANQSLNFSFTQPDKPKENAGYNFNLNPTTNLNNSITSSKPTFNFGAPANNFSSQTTSTPFKFENNNFNQINKPPSINFSLQSTQTNNNANQLKPATQNPPSFNFAAAATQPNTSSFQFGAQSTIANKPENSFTSPSFNFNPSTSNNIFTIGRK